MKRTLQIFLLTVVASTAVACACGKTYPYEPPPDPECVIDNDCIDGQICKEGECVPKPPPLPECSDAYPCREGEQCEEGQCVPKPPPDPECFTDKDCLQGQVCQIDPGICIEEPPPPPDPDCVTDADCAENQTCEAPGVCVDIPPPPPPECVIDADCDGALVCEAGICVEPSPCEDNVDCELGSACEVEEGECGVIDPDAGCVEQQGYWKNNPNDPTWQQLEPIELGGASYTQAEATALMQSPSDGDASLILIKQLIAAILNHGAGAGAPQSVIDAFDAGQQWLLLNADADGRLPFGVDTSSAAGQEALALAAFFESYNKGLVAGGPPLCE